jgi:hypothetical protein
MPGDVVLWTARSNFFPHLVQEIVEQAEAIQIGTVDEDEVLTANLRRVSCMAGRFRRRCRRFRQFETEWRAEAVTAIH